jgi:hypothetical protein
MFMLPVLLFLQSSMQASLLRRSYVLCCLLFLQSSMQASLLRRRVGLRAAYEVLLEEKLKRGRFFLNTRLLI